MGNAISGLPPLSVATSVIGIVSFVFTLLTAIRVFWENLRTLVSADTEVRVLLPSIKQALYEERHHLRTIRRRCRAQYEEGAFRILDFSVREMLSDFKRLERPFVEYPEGTDYRRDRGRDKGVSSGMRTEREKARMFSMEMGRAGRGQRDNTKSRGNRHRDRDARSDDDDANERPNGTVADSSDEYYNVDFRAVSLWQRLAWIRYRSQAMELSSRLSRLQGRRMARQTTDISVDTKYVARVIAELQDRIENLEGRLGRGGGRRTMD